MGWYGLDSSGSRLGQVAGSCERGTELQLISYLVKYLDSYEISFKIHYRYTKTWNGILIWLEISVDHQSCFVRNNIQSESDIYMEYEIF
jgi:hypothetical protein